MSADAQELIALTQKLLDSIDQRDWVTYTALCDPGLTAFEPEAQGHRVSGMRFHAFYLEGEKRYESSVMRQSSISSPDVRFFGEAALVTYIRLVQMGCGDFQDEVVPFEESRLWERQNGQWRHVHFHRSRPGKD